MRRPASYFGPAHFRRMTRFSKQLLGYQLITVVFTLPLAAPVVGAVAVIRPAALPTAGVAVCAYIMIRWAFLVRDVNDGRLDPPTEFEGRATAVESAAAVAAELSYIAAVVALAIAVGHAHAGGMLTMWTATAVPWVDRWLLRRYHRSPAAVPPLLLVAVLVRLGVLSSTRGDWLHGYGWARRPRRPA